MQQVLDTLLAGQFEGVGPDLRLVDHRLEATCAVPSLADSLEHETELSKLVLLQHNDEPKLQVVVSWPKPSEPESVLVHLGVGQLFQLLAVIPDHAQELGLSLDELK